MIYYYYFSSIFINPLPSAHEVLNIYESLTFLGFLISFIIVFVNSSPCISIFRSQKNSILFTANKNDF